MDVLGAEKVGPWKAVQAIKKIVDLVTQLQGISRLSQVGQSLRPVGWEAVAGTQAIERRHGAVKARGVVGPP